ncbi:HAD family hydrolase [Gluconacetobacter johannae DSM 13595]|uniref:Haloacid dehalogenase type II n=1 Tax=Gluconacetobacter johannae TaxID=112140 RepID=A0A7W4J7Y2_9PROT|nr:haloacid dehalogenase type II [Gluconacetobacter johannae]MBB2176183.1 haloacid dehalogenase type II [Gluconacetobacter johannae]GBQ89256.1 HAD family hydrolase [Gluconacetobacter johannae DSM 13595]
MKLSDFKLLTFDCYGTLIDWETGILQGLAPLIDQLSGPVNHHAILQVHARHESRQQQWTPGRPYPAILATVYRRLAEEWGLPVSLADAEAYGRSIPSWPAFPDTVAALAYLKRHFRLVVLSNVDMPSFAATNARLHVAFDAVYTAEDIGSYKPSHRNFEYMLEHLHDLGLSARDVLHTAESLFHDHVPANAFGLASCWIARRHARPGLGATMEPGAMPNVNFRFDSLADLVTAHRAEIAAA